MNCATATGQLTGPLLLNAVDAPRYLPGLRSLMIAQVVLCACVALQVVNLYFFNRRKEATRESLGMPRKMADTSMDRKFVQMDEQTQAEKDKKVDDDLTDWANPRFTYVY
jgi:hypothetical protein